MLTPVDTQRPAISSSAPPLKVPDAFKMPATVAPDPTAVPATHEVKKATTSPFQKVNAGAPQPAATFQKEPETQMVLRLLEDSFKTLVNGVDLKRFDPAKIEDYMTRAEKRFGTPMSDVEKEQFREMAKSNDPQMLRYLALEFGVGVSKKDEKKTMALLGQLVLHRGNEAVLRQFMASPDKDPNLVAYVRTMLMMNRMERLWNRYENLKRKLKRGFVGRAIVGLWDKIV